MLKIDMHLHAKGDKHDHCSYTVEELIEIAAKKGFDCLAITFHERVYFTNSMVCLAKKHRIVLIPGCEMTILGRHVLIYNADQDKLKKIVNDIQAIDRFDKIKELKDDSLVIAPHPYFRIGFIGTGLSFYMEENIDAFDAVEYSHFHTTGIDLNKKAVEFAKRNNKPIVGTSDLHFMCGFDHTYSLVDSKKDAKSILSAIKYGNVVLKTKPLSKFLFFKIAFLHVFKRF